MRASAERAERAETDDIDDSTNNNNNIDHNGNKNIDDNSDNANTMQIYKHTRSRPTHISAGYQEKIKWWNAFTRDTPTHKHTQHTNLLRAISAGPASPPPEGDWFRLDDDDGW